MTKIVNMACYLINMSPRASLEGMVTWELQTGNPTDLNNLRIFGCHAYVYISNKDLSKLDPKSKMCVIIGYNKVVKVSSYGILLKNIVISKDIVFDEQLILKHKITIYVSASEEETSSK